MNGVNLMMGRWLLVVMMMAALMVPLQSQAQSQTPEAMIRDNVESLMSELEGRKDYYANNLSELEALVDSNLEQVADFRYIGASVMGNYFRNASPEQRRRFVDVFRQTLIDTYTRGLVTFDYDELRVLNAQQAQRYDDQASVAMEVVANNGKVYPVSYSLRLSDGEWRVVNVIVNGINLGLTFRNQFDQAMRDNNRDYDAVIDGWSPEVGVEELEQGGDA
ncbi:ABC transporter substrate-binding protein [Vreelandella titanicae]|uniref:Phospholipid-binding protein MlaC n=2 Tax=Oceanospirillales TaxID=135619 RepID=A0A653PWX4_9GAMM|nr:MULTISPECIES: ABC transporter substrate-binding protein [Halomonas]UEQ05926.1 ABC transporter substrate-binding protein [Halomonas profundus]KIN16578.1 toluene tolerance protein [Halomonas sp. KHS3]MCE7519583.1 ABC transporter substrate-binding protein [Halomonas titanicae]QKS23017.1 putative phospholipid-binding protein MlaC [Halomonas titanicae]CAD5263006.1 Toluene tolerance protein [Halomonas sp. 156]